jgi:hypothetical protein
VRLVFLGQARKRGLRSFSSSLRVKLEKPLTIISRSEEPKLFSKIKKWGQYFQKISMT